MVTIIILTQLIHQISSGATRKVLNWVEMEDFKLELTSAPSQLQGPGQYLPHLYSFRLQEMTFRLWGRFSETIPNHVTSWPCF